ncbi:MAG: UvrD/REP helicase protein [Bacteroidetes bacterium]|nr:UvrD/REP helicase protein [Bacteroidota bacterium]
MLTILDNDRQFARELPKYTVVSASAGSGKTRALKQRFVQLLISRAIPNNSLKNVLAITFTNNAAREMKQRVLDALKSASLGKRETLEELQQLLSLSSSELQIEAGRLVDEILDNYSDFQIRTIDSFLARVFKASALELGQSPDLDIVLDSDAILDEAFGLFARELHAGTSSARLFDQLIQLLLETRGSDDRFFWNPYPELADKVKDLYKRIILTSKQLRLEDHSDEIRALGGLLPKKVLELDKVLSHPKIAKIKRFEDYVGYAKADDVDCLISYKFPSSPMKKTESDPKQFQRALQESRPLCEEIAALRAQLILLKARQHYQPYAEAHALLSKSIEAVKRERGQVDIGDVVKRLAMYLKPGIVPEVYYSLGETLCHYLIDEFQDTNPIQWETLEPLVGNALATRGSLFVVGDTKQSIYGFRGADWRIMKRLQVEDVFPSATKDLKSLDTNYRSFEKILRFNGDVFKTILPQKVDAEAARASGLATDEQHVRDSFVGKGYVEVISIPVDAAEGQPDRIPQKEKVLQIVADCLSRGYRRSDITILSPRNGDIIEISGWLNERDISFISHSSLDVRSRAVTGELLALLRFLDSPIDDLSFATFLLGNIFGGLLQRDNKTISRQNLLDLLFEHRLGHRREHPLYITFRRTYPDLWRMYFEDLFNVVGYLPVYDLISEAFSTFNIFALLRQEEATLAKILEVVKDFEEQGENSLKGFLQFAGDSSEDADWNIDIPTDVDAVRVMTIHKAKGLESRVVIVLLYDSTPRRDSLYFEEAGDEVRLVRLAKDVAEEVDELSGLYREKTLRQTVDDLNKLYVAFTRAEEEMYVISVQAKRSKTPSEYLPESGYGPEMKPAVQRVAPKPEISVELSHDLPRTPIRQVEYAGIAVAEARRGEFVHAVLEAIEYVGPDIEARLAKAGERALVRIPFETDPMQLRDVLLSVIALSELRPYFLKSEGRDILNEQEFVGGDGALVRMDRVVVDPGAVTVIDYKTGEEKPDYTEQVLKYMKILRSYYAGRSIHGLLVYVDQKLVRTV